MGFVPSKVTGTYEQIEVIHAAVAVASVSDPHEQKAAARFLIHVLTTTPREDDEDEKDGFVPVPAKVIERYFRRLDWRPLQETGLVEVKAYSRVRRKCREFRATHMLQRAFYEAGPTAARVVRDGLYDLVSGNPTRARKKSQRRTASGNALPKLVRGAIDSVVEVPIDVTAIEHHLEKLRCLMDEAEAGPAWTKAQGRYLNDLRCYQAALMQGARPLNPEEPSGLWVYRPAYRPQRFGRVSQIGGGLQSCSTEMKSVAYPTDAPLPC